MPLPLSCFASLAVGGLPVLDLAAGRKTHQRTRLSCLASLAIATIATSTAADVITGVDAGSPPHVKLFDATSAETGSFLAYGAGFTGGVRVAAGDISGDGLDDIITGAGSSGGGHVKVFQRTSGTEIRSFFAYGPSFTGGIFVAGGDVNHDSVDDIITGVDSGFSSHVKAFSGIDGSELRSFFAYGIGFTGGVRVAAGDVDNDGFDDIITGAGPAGSGHVKVFSGSTGTEIRSFLAYGPSYTGGVFVGAGDVNNDGLDDIITGVDGGFAPHVKVFSGADGSELRSFFAFAPGVTGGVRVAGGDVNGDGFVEIIAGAGEAGGGHVKVFNGVTLAETQSFLAYGSSYAGGVFVAGARVIPEPPCIALLLAGVVGLIGQRPYRLHRRSASI